MASEKQKQAWDRYFAKVERRKKMLELYHKGLIDREIAAEAGVSTTTVNRWRHKNNLPSNSGSQGCRDRSNAPKERAFASKKHKQRFEAYNQGLIDREIAAKEGLDTGTISHWRHRNNLPANGNGGCGFTGRCGVSMEKVLDPDQCEIVRQFFGCLLAMQDRFPGQEIDVGVFMREYRAGGHARRSSCAVC